MALCILTGTSGGGARMSGAFTRTLDMLGLGSRLETTGQLARSKEDVMLQQQVHLCSMNVS